MAHILTPIFIQMSKVSSWPDMNVWLLSVVGVSVGIGIDIGIGLIAWLCG